jgi:hypothetical protein
MYSFLKINEQKMHKFNTKRRLVKNNIVSKLKNSLLFKKKLYSSHKSFFNFFRSSIKQLSHFSRPGEFSNSVFLIEDVFTKSNLIKYQGLHEKSIKIAKRLKPFRVGRVKFKPGYQRI